jgi:hypothetical protein
MKNDPLGTTATLPGTSIAAHPFGIIERRTERRLL